MKRPYLITLILSFMMLNSCQKYLDAKPDKALTVPNTVEDYQAILDNYSAFAAEPNTGEISSDDYYLTDENYLSLASEADKRAYIWEKDNLFELNNNPWSEFSNTIYYCNTVLEGVEKLSITSSIKNTADNLKGQALYFRSKRLFQAALIWCQAYDEKDAVNRLGLPLRLNTNFNERSVRADLKQTYDKIVADLKIAATILPVNQPGKVRASKPAAYALLSRVYLSMRNYADAGSYADSCLSLYSSLMDYNLVDPLAAMPLARFNSEVITENQLSSGQILNLTRAKISLELYNTFDDPNDLRRQILFVNNGDGTVGYKGRFTQAAELFGGMATNEIFLNQAECLIRAGKTNDGLAYLNNLLIKRWKSGTFTPYAGLGKEEALVLTLKERRKELIFRGIRWMDLKRLNMEGSNITLTRNINGKQYTLTPNDLRYALPIPEEIISISGMPQNPR